MSSCTEKKFRFASLSPVPGALTPGPRTETRLRERGTLLALVAVLTVLATLPACHSASPVAPTEEYVLAGRWTIDYGRSARSILENRGMATDSAHANIAEMQLKQKFYGEFQFTDSSTYALLYRIQGKESKDFGSFTIREHQGRRFLLVARSKGQDSSHAEETFTVEFIEANLMRLQKDDEKDLPPLVFQREEVKP